MIERRWRGPGKANEFILYPQFILHPYLPTNEMLRTIFSIVLWCTWIMMLKLQMLEAVLPAIDSSSSPSLRCEELFWSYLQGPFVAMWTNPRAKPGKRQQSRWKDLISSHSSLCFPVRSMRLFNGLQNSIRTFFFFCPSSSPPSLTFVKLVISYNTHYDFFIFAKLLQGIFPHPVFVQITGLH